MAAAIRFAAAAFMEGLHAFLAWNAILVVLVAVVLVPVAGTPLAVAVVPVAVVALNPLLRLAAVARRERVITLRAGVDGLTHRTPAKAVVSAGVAVVLGLAALNLAILPALGDVLAGMVGMTSVIVAAAVTALGLSTLALLNDPARDRDRAVVLLRLAASVVLRHPAAWLALLVLTILTTLIVRELLWPMLVLPALISLVVAGLVLPAADVASAILEDAPTQPSGSARAKTRGSPARSSRTG